MPSLVPSPIKDATATHRGLMGITAQTFAGVKTFLNAIKLGLFSTVGLPVGSEGYLVYDTTTKRPQVHDGTAWIPVAMSVSGGSAASLEEHILSADAHSANNIAYEGGATPWANGTNHTANDMEEAISAIVASLADAAGAAKVGTTASGTLSGITVQAQLNELDSEKTSVTSLATSTGTTLVGGAAKSGMTWFQLTAGTLKVQLEELLTHVNTVRPDVVTPTLLTLPINWSGDLTYAKDNGNWGHVLGRVQNNTGGTVFGTYILMGNLPIGMRPTKTVWGYGFELTNLNQPTGTKYLMNILTSGDIQIVGDVPDTVYVTMDFPAYKCS